MSKAQKNSTNVCSGKDVLKSVAKRVRAAGGKFGEDLVAARKAMERLAKAYKPRELAERAFSLSEAFRPEIPSGKRGWGAKGDLDLGRIEHLAKRKT